MPQFEPLNFFMPFLAHALDTPLGTFSAVKFFTVSHWLFAMINGVFFLIGGIAVNMMIPGPMCFTILDIVLGYLPKAWIGFRLAGK